MPTTLIRLNVFLSSPFGLDPEKDIIKSIIRDLNAQTSSIYRLELLNWDDLPPTATADRDVQLHINEKIKNYDIYLGILWNRFGTKTKRADSGTEEEFNLAYARFLTKRDDIEILVYFKTDGMDVSPLSKDSQRVIDFMNRLKADGVIYKKFNEKTHTKFKKDVKRHLDAAAREIVAKTLHKEKNLENIHNMFKEAGAQFTAIRKRTEYPDIKISSYQHKAVIEKRNLTNIVTIYGENCSDHVVRSLTIVSEATNPTEAGKMQIKAKDLLKSCDLYTQCTDQDHNNVKDLQLFFNPPLAPKDSFGLQFSFLQKGTMFFKHDFITSSYSYENDLDDYQLIIEFKDKPPKIVTFTYYDENLMEIKTIQLLEKSSGPSTFEISMSNSDYNLLRKLHSVSTFTRAT